MIIQNEELTQLRGPQIRFSAKFIGFLLSKGLRTNFISTRPFAHPEFNSFNEPNDTRVYLGLNNGIDSGEL